PSTLAPRGRMRPGITTTWSARCRAPTTAPVTRIEPRTRAPASTSVPSPSTLPSPTAPAATRAPGPTTAATPRPPAPTRADGAPRVARPARQGGDPPVRAGDHGPVGARVGIGQQGQGRRHAGGAVPGEEVLEVEVEQHVAVHEQERLVAEEVPHPPRAPAGAENGPLPRPVDGQAAVTAIPHRRGDGLRDAQRVHDHLRH